MTWLNATTEARLLAALWVSQGWYDAFVGKIHSTRPSTRRSAVYARARAAVVYDRILNDENRGFT